MQFLTAEEVAKILRVSLCFVYQNRQLFGGIKLGKVVRFDKEIFESKIKEVNNGNVQTTGQLGIRFLEEQSSPPESGIPNKTTGKNSRIRSAKESKTDEFGFHRLVREQIKGHSGKKD
jgi:hypothetical protein